MNDARDVLVEATLSAWRERDVFGRLCAAPAWSDLAPEDRERAFDAQLALRRVERALDARGLSTTAHAVLARVRFVAQLGPG